MACRGRGNGWRSREGVPFQSNGGSTRERVLFFFFFFFGEVANQRGKKIGEGDKRNKILQFFFLSSSVS